jgi:peroxiredoxin Q/BCP
VVLYFYPKDDTPGCTLEGRDFNAHYAKFARKGAVILGVSRDNLRSHEKFCDKFGFKFDLLSDEDEKLCTLFGVMKEKNMYGKKVWGIERSTFLIGRDGVLAREWRKVQVQGHAGEVLEALGGSIKRKPASKKRPAKKKKKAARSTKR